MSWSPRIGLIFLALGATPALAGGPDGISQKTGQITQLGKRLAPLNARLADPPSTTHWQAATALIDGSDATQDADADAAAGHAGFMTHANDAIAERPHAPGLYCYIRSEAGRRAVFLYRYRGSLAREATRTLLAFDAYARVYNIKIIKSGALGETSCAATGE